MTDTRTKGWMLNPDRQVVEDDHIKRSKDHVCPICGTHYAPVDYETNWTGWVKRCSCKRALK